MVGKTISHYKIIEKLGEGGMGVVYKAEDTKLKRTVALKFLPAEFTRDNEAKIRFMHEAQAASALEHNNICNIHEINETDDGQMFIVMACYEGETLKDKIEKGPLKINQAMDIVIQMAEGLNKAHKKEIIHRDIKSANILITDEGIVKILDFGLAKLRGHTRLTKESTTLGTVAYMSPEQTTGETVDQHSDIWSLGVVFYEMLTGQLPFRGHYEQAIVYSIMNEEPQTIRELIPDVQEQLEQILNKMLAKDPSKRYPNLNEFLEDLKRFKKGKELKEITIEPKYKIIPTPKSLVLGIFFLATIIIAAFFIFKGKAEPEIPPIEPGKKPSLAVLYFDNDSGNETLDVWRYGLAKLLITDLSQSRYLDVLPADELHNIVQKLNLVKARNYTSKDLIEIGKKAGVDHILTSNFIKIGEKFVITSQLKNLETNRVEHAFKLIAINENEVFAKVDELTRNIKIQLKLTEKQMTADLDQSIIDVTTANTQALIHFIEAERFHHLNKQYEAFEQLKKAIELDPQFAMAHFLLSITYNNSGRRKEKLFHLQKSFELSKHLIIKERYMIESQYYYNKKEFDQAIDKLKDLLKIYPDHVNARYFLGHNYYSLGERDKAIEQYIQIKNKTKIQYTNLIHTYWQNKDYRHAHRVCEEYLSHSGDFPGYVWNKTFVFFAVGKLDPAMELVKKGLLKSSTIDDKYWFKLFKAFIHFCKDNFTEALALYEDLQKIAPDNFLIIYGRASIYLTKGQFNKAFSEYNLWYKNEKKKSRLRYMIGARLLQGELYFRSGDLKKALESFTQIEKLISDSWEKIKFTPKKPKNQLALFWKGLTFLKMGELDKAESLVTEIERSYYPLDKLRFLDILLNGCIALEKGNFSEAIDCFKQANADIILQVFWMNHNCIQALILHNLAQAHKLNGEIHQAIDVYKKLARLTVGRQLLGYLYTESFYHLGNLYKKLGEKNRAIENYYKFIELWKDCDPPLKPMVEDARKRVKELEGNK